jgi:outer membrane murein-binding lipoprotein Lpp
MWTAQNVLTLAVALTGASVSIGMLLAKVNTLTGTVRELRAMIDRIDRTRQRQGERLGEIERWIAAEDAIQRGATPALPARKDTRGIPIPVRAREESSEEEGGGGG